MLTLSTHVSGFTLHTIIWFTLSKHMLRLKVSNFHRSSFFSYLHSPHMFQDSLSIQLFGLHSPSTCYVQNFQIFTGDHFFMLTLSTHVSGFTPYSYLVHTLHAHVRFKIFGFSHDFIFSYVHSPLMFQSSLSMQLFLNSPSRCYKILYSYYNFMMCLNAPLNHECLTP